LFKIDRLVSRAVGGSLDQEEWASGFDAESLRHDGFGGHRFQPVLGLDERQVVLRLQSLRRPASSPEGPDGFGWIGVARTLKQHGERSTVSLSAVRWKNHEPLRSGVNTSGTFAREEPTRLASRVHSIARRS
jgi:hypothetical protein